jgi:hypothetical protein
MDKIGDIMLSLIARKVDDEILIQQDASNECIHMYSRKLFSFKIKDLASMLSFLVKKGFISKKVLEGILAEVEE